MTWAALDTAAQRAAAAAVSELSSSQQEQRTSQAPAGPRVGWDLTLYPKELNVAFWREQAGKYEKWDAQVCAGVILAAVQLAELAGAELAGAAATTHGRKGQTLGTAAHLQHSRHSAAAVALVDCRSASQCGGARAYGRQSLP